MDEIAPAVLQELRLVTSDSMFMLRAHFGDSLGIRSQQGRAVGYLPVDEPQPPSEDFRELDKAIRDVLESYHIYANWMVDAACNTLTSSSRVWTPFRQLSSEITLQLKWDPSRETESEFRSRANAEFDEAAQIQKQLINSGVSTPNIRKTKKVYRVAMQEESPTVSTVYDLFCSTDLLWSLQKAGIGHEYRTPAKHMEWFVRYQVLCENQRDIAGQSNDSTVSKAVPQVANALGIPLRPPERTGRPPKEGGSDV
jgi:hypothetical protein